MKFSIKKSFPDLVTFTEEILNEKLHFCAVNHMTLWLRAPHPSHHCAKFDAWRSYASKDETFSFCHTTSFDHMIKGTCDLVRGRHSV